MANSFKQSGAWVTAWSSDPFRQARIKLTLWYMAIILVIVTVFSISFYVVASEQISRSFHQYVHSEQDQEENFLEDAHERLAWLLLAIDGAVLLVSAFSSYGFAGYTLKPIKITLDGQKRFVADASHELRTPLAVMRTDIEVLLRQKTGLPAPVQNTLHSILEEVSVLTIMNNQLLELSETEGKSFSSHFSFLDIQPSVVKIVNRFQNLAHSRGIVLTMGDFQAVKVLGNQHFLESALSNVIGNAIKYNKVNGTVEVSVISRNNRAEIKIIDTGIGISEKNLPLIFERFYQGDLSKHSQGTGLGLSITKAIVDAHRGFISVQSRLGLGTDITISLPAVKNL